MDNSINNINFAAMLEGMDERLRRHIALCMLITVVDYNNGSVEINSDTVRRVFNDENQVVKIEYTNGVIALAADADFDTMNDAIFKWKDDNPKQFAEVNAELDRRIKDLGIGL